MVSTRRITSLHRLPCRDYGTQPCASRGNPANYLMYRTSAIDRSKRANGPAEEIPTANATNRHEQPVVISNPGVYGCLTMYLTMSSCYFDQVLDGPKYTAPEHYHAEVTSRSTINRPRLCVFDCAQLPWRSAVTSCFRDIRLNLWLGTLWPACIAAWRLYSTDTHIKWEVQFPLLFGLSPYPSQFSLYQVRRVGASRLAVLH